MLTCSPESCLHNIQHCSVEGLVKVANLTGARVERLPYPLEGLALSRADNAKNTEEERESAKFPYRTLVGMISYVTGHTKPDIAYALNVVSRYCNNPGPRHITFLKTLIKYCEYSKDDRLKFTAHPGPYDAKTMQAMVQLRFQVDADLGGNLDNDHSTTSFIGYLGPNNVVCYVSKTQGSMSTSTAESEIKAVNQCLKDELIAMRNMLTSMGFPQDTTIIEEDNQACVYASETTLITKGLRHLQLNEKYFKVNVQNGIVKLMKVASGDNTSDIGTKRLPQPLFNKLVSRIIDQTLRVNLK